MLSHLRIAAASWLAELRPALLHRRFADARSLEQMQHMVPLSLAMKQLEGVLLDPSLPPDAHAGNLAAFATLRSFVASLSSTHAYPPASIKAVHFSVPDAKKLQRTRVLLKTTGGDCSRLVQQTFRQLLERCGLNGAVYFDGDQFNPKPERRAPEQRPAGPRPAPPSPERVDQIRAEAAAAGFPSQTITEEQFEELEADQAARRGDKAAAANASEALRADLERLEPLLRACAAVPWLPRDEDGLRRVAKIKAEVVDGLEAWGEQATGGQRVLLGLSCVHASSGWGWLLLSLIMTSCWGWLPEWSSNVRGDCARAGWDVRGALARIWAGERSEAALCAGKEGGTKEAIQALLFYAKQNDSTYGLKAVQKQ
jgi:hypothetical protein